MTTLTNAEFKKTIPRLENHRLALETVGLRRGAINSHKAMRIKIIKKEASRAVTSFSIALLSHKVTKVNEMGLFFLGNDIKD